MSCSLPIKILYCPSIEIFISNTTTEVRFNFTPSFALRNVFLIFIFNFCDGAWNQKADGAGALGFHRLIKLTLPRFTFSVSRFFMVKV